ncbi:MAG: beta strand repeat-containing protein [Planctomycetaceae bacterium]
MLSRLRRSALVCGIALGSLVAPITAPAHAAGIIRITEVMSNSTVANSAGSIFNGDWFELTNYGDASMDISGWKMDDNSFSFASSVALNGVSTVGIGESVVFVENTLGDKVADFKTFWGLGSTMQVGSYGGSGVGLSSTADGVVVYTSGGTEISKVSFGAATSNRTFFWSYDASGVLGTTATGIVSVSGSGGAYTTSAGGANANVGSPGSAVTLASIPNLYWTANGSSLGGSGTWSGSGNNWSTGTSSIAGTTWADGKSAFFQGTAGTVTLGSALAAGSVTISSNGYTLAGTGTNSLNTPSIEVTNGGDTATVSARLVGSGGLAKGGNGILIVSNTTNAYTGATSVVTGTLQSGAANVIPDASQLSAARFTAHDFAGFADTVAGISGLGLITNIGGLTVNITGTSDIRYDGALSGSGNFIVDSAGTGRQVFNSSNLTETDGATKNYTGATVIRRGILAISNGVNRVPNATSGVEIETDGRLELTSNNATYTIGSSAATVVTLKGGSLGQEQDKDVTLANAVNVATSSSILVKNTTTPVIPANTEEVTLSGVLSGSAGTILSLTASNQTPGADSGRVLFTNASGNSYAGTVSVGQNMTGRFNGDYSTTAVLLNGGAVEGNGSVKSIGGLGFVSPGTSPGILTVETVDPASGIDFEFEFTATGGPTYNAPAASVNDVLRLTGGSPFTGSMSAGNVIDVYFGLATVLENAVFQGGFFTLSNVASALASATLRGWVLGNGAGTDAFLNNVGYYSLANYNASLSLQLESISVAADFGSGPVNGFVTQVTVVPEPGSIALAAGGLLLAGWVVRRRRRLTPARA